jgi:hypothetical protein
MECLEGNIVRFTKRDGQLLGRICLCTLERLAGELQTAKEPHQPFRRFSLLLAFLILHQFFQGI